MRTTLDVADDVLLAVKERARRERRTVGDVLSDLARRALTRTDGDVKASRRGFFGFAPLPHRGPAVSHELIDQLRDEELE
jgi:hypothetical protein